MSDTPSDIDADSQHGDIVYPSAIPFVVLHAACLAAIWTGVTWQAVALGAILYWLRMFAITAGYHRYFSHRAYATGRIVQFLLAFVAQSSAQKSVLWWAAKHRHHHLHSDTARDVHSPLRKGFLYSHVGWIFDRRHDATDLTKVADLARYPELMWLHRLELLPAVVVGTACLLVGGWSGLIVGFVWSTVLTYHGTFCINSLAHVHGSKRYVTGDESRNNWLLALLTLGEGWHNNHHAYQSSARQGFRRWEVDPTYYVLRVLSWLGIVWDLRTPPEQVLRNEQRLNTRVIVRAAEQLAARFHSSLIAHAVATDPNPPAPGNAVSSAGYGPADVLAALHLPHRLPTREEFLAEARSMFVRTRSLDAIVDHAYQLFLASVRAQPSPVAH